MKSFPLLLSLLFAAGSSSSTACAQNVKILNDRSSFDKNDFVFYLSPSFTYGPGFSSINFLDSGHRFAYYYAERIVSSIQLSMATSVSFHRFYLGGKISIEHIEGSEFTSYYTDNITGKVTANREGVNWPTGRFNFEAFAGYDLHIAGALSLMADFAIGSFNDVNQRYFIYPKYQRGPDFFKHRSSASYGGQIRYALGDRALFFLEANRKFSFFNASKNFTDIDPSSYEFQFRQFYYGVGIQCALASF